jgi:hypothetical protein
MTYIPPTYFKPATTDTNLHSQYVKLHCHANGTQGQTNTVDSSIYNNTLNMLGNAIIDATNPKFGTGCFYFGGGGSVYCGEFDRIVNLSNKDFTIEFWINIPQQSSDKPIINCSSNADQRGWYLATTSNPADPLIGFLYTLNGIFSWKPVLLSSSTLPLNVWNHVAICRDNNFLIMFINGAMQTNYVKLLPTDTFNSPYDLYMGYYPHNGLYLTGRLDEVRITSGYTWYRGGNFYDSGILAKNFLAPTQAFTDSISSASATIGEIKPDGYNALTIKNASNIWTRLDDTGMDLRYVRGNL